MQTVKLLLVVSAFPAQSETFIIQKVLGLKRAGIDVHVECHLSQPSQWDVFKGLLGGDDLRSRVHVRWPHRPRWLALALCPVALARCLVRNPRGTARYLAQGYRLFGLDVVRHLYLDAEVVASAPDVVHFEFGSLAVERMWFREALDLRMVVSFRGFDIHYAGLEEEGYYDQLWENVDSIHTLSQHLADQARQRGCPEKIPLVIIPPAIDGQFFSPDQRAAEKHVRALGAPDRPLRILSVGRATWVKGYEYTLQAVQTLVRSGIACEYRIIGAGDSLEALSFARHQLGLEETVHLLGSRPREEVREWMNWADVFLHGAVAEGFCNAVLEAQAMSLPVVSSDAGGLPENVVHGGTGLIVPRRDPGAMAEALRILAQDAALRQRMGQAGRDRVAKQFNLQDQIAAFHSLYRDLMRARDRRAATPGAAREPGSPAESPFLTVPPGPAYSEPNESG